MYWELDVGAQGFQRPLTRFPQIGVQNPTGAERHREDADAEQKSCLTEDVRPANLCAKPEVTAAI